MTAVAFDTHDAANRFKAAGFTEAQVEALVDVTRMTTALPDTSTLATKADLKTETSLLRTDLKAEISDLRSELRAEVSDLRTELKVEIAGVRSDLKREIAGVKTLIATSQVQTLTVTLAAMAAMFTVFKLIH
jgi:hypothetical protein